ncbi:hypothetical protein AKJ09_01877 [Labilithrix luteola]|uniref:Uncharacterized protein n=1 Tax=Labilithrix luteola TaxID=1391654 RepID=A0A0K1PNX2_9BACT|nr:hypothetical protein AKJ09_01877 [Labilithrix luteola]
MFGVIPAAFGEEGRVEAIQLHYAVEERLAGHCPDRSRFVALLLAERPRLSLATDDPDARRFDVRIRASTNGKLEGELVIAKRDGSADTRNVDARDCRALVRALAVVTAVATDLAAVDAADDAPHQIATHDDGAAAGDRAESAERVAPAETVDRPAESPPRRSPRGPATVALGVGVGTELVLGALPRPTMGYRGYVEAQRSLGVLDGGLRASLAFARAQLSDTSELNVFVQTWTARLEGCVGRRILAPLSLEGCLDATGGAYHSYSTGVSNARNDVRPWFTVGSDLRIRWHLGRAFHAEVFGNASYVPTVYATVARDQVGASHDVPRAIGEIGIGVGHSFGGK